MLLFPIFHFLALLVVVIRCDAGRILPRGPCSGISGPGTWNCPDFDQALYPLAATLSMEVDEGEDHYLQCLYPFLSNCRYSTSTGKLLVDNDNLLCPNATQHGDRSYSCPLYDLGNYGLGLGSQAHDQASVLFCTYPTNDQLNSETYFCRYSTDNGMLYWGIDPIYSKAPDVPGFFCPPVAVCTDGSHSSISMAPAPASSDTVSKESTASPTDKNPRPSTTSPNSAMSLQRHDMMLATVVVLLVMWFI